MAGNVDRAIILVVLPLNALMRDQIAKLNERGLTSFMGRSVQVEDSRGGEYQTSFSMEALKEPLCRTLFQCYLFIWWSVWMIAVLFHY